MYVSVARETIFLQIAKWKSNKAGESNDWNIKKSLPRFGGDFIPSVGVPRFATSLQRGTRDLTDPNHFQVFGTVDLMAW